MNAFSNENIKDKLCGGCECSGFAAALAFSYNAGASTITVTDNSTYEAGDARKIVHLKVIDKNGAEVVGNIAAADGDDAVTLSTATLDASGGFRINATVVTNNGCISDGHAEAIGISVTEGDFGYWDKDNNSITIGATDDES